MPCCISRPRAAPALGRQEAVDTAEHIGWPSVGWRPGRSAGALPGRDQSGLDGQRDVCASRSPTMTQSPAATPSTAIKMSSKMRSGVPNAGQQPLATATGHVGTHPRRPSN